MSGYTRWNPCTGNYDAEKIGLFFSMPTVHCSMFTRWCRGPGRELRAIWKGFPALAAKAARIYMVALAHGPV